MMILRKSEDRRHFAVDGNQTWMTFDPENSADPLAGGFHGLAFLNEERLAPESRFKVQGPPDAEFVIHSLAGDLVYKGPQGKTGFLEPGEFRLIQVPRGVRYNTINLSRSASAHAIQSGFTPPAGTPALKGDRQIYNYPQRSGILRLIASPDGREGSILLLQDAWMYWSAVPGEKEVVHVLRPGRSAWIHVVKGRILLQPFYLKSGDGAGFAGEGSVSFTAKEPSEVLLYDLP